MASNEPYHDRNDASAWQSNMALALLCGIVSGVLSRAGEDHGWTVEMPNGYAPVLELVRPDGSRYRLRLEQVPTKELT